MQKTVKTRKPVGPVLKWVLWILFGGFALLVVNSVYLASITLLEWKTGLTYQDYFYLWMFMGHLVLGLAIILPLILFGIFHIRNARHRPNRRAIRVGYVLLVVSCLVLVTGIALTRVDLGFARIDLADPAARNIVYWLHVILPAAVIWLFVLHRLAGRPLRWRLGVGWGLATAAFSIVMVFLHSQDPRQWNVEGPADGEQYFYPSLARTSTGNFIPARSLMLNRYCMECHPDVHDDWAHSVHAFSSFNNPPYAASVRKTRQVLFERDGDVKASRFCAGCHDPVPFFSGAFDDPRYDDPDYDLDSDPLGSAGVNCVVCHSITHINSPMGNADYTIEEPPLYPFTHSESPLLRWVNRQLVKAKPQFHKKTFLKPQVHRSAEFCGSCHKVHLPVELNDYKWLRGQDHYDSWLLSGASGHGIQSWYYPLQAQTNCNGCHMPLVDSTHFGARVHDDSGVLKLHDHSFPSANTAIPRLVDMPDADEVIRAHQQFNEGVFRLDIFGIHDGGTIESELYAPIGPEIPVLESGRSYLLDVIVRTLEMGHVFTQGTSDSNQVWLDVTVSHGDRIIGRSGGMDGGRVDPWSKFYNSFVVDREGRRIDRRNPEDIFVSLYDHQVPPGAADLTHLLLEVPEGLTGTLKVDAHLRYRKFDSTYMEFVRGDDAPNQLPVMTLASDSVTFQVSDVDFASSTTRMHPVQFPLWQRWNDYGIGLYRKGDSGSGRGELRQAEAAFEQVRRLGRGDGALNLARVYIKEGRLDEAVDVLKGASEGEHPAYPWSIAYFSAIVDHQNGNLDAAIRGYEDCVNTRFQEAVNRGFDFSRDYRLLNQLARALQDRSRLERGDSGESGRIGYLKQAARVAQQALDQDPENATSWYILWQVQEELGNQVEAEHAFGMHEKYRVDDNARDNAITEARIRYPAANKAAESIVIYDLNRPGAFTGRVEPLIERCVGSMHGNQ